MKFFVDAQDDHRRILTVQRPVRKVLVFCQDREIVLQRVLPDRNVLGFPQANISSCYRIKTCQPQLERAKEGGSWLRIGNATNPVLLGWFMPLIPAVLARIQDGDKLIEVR